MARKNRIDRGLVKRTNAAGKEVWYVRVGVGGGKEKWFGSFPTKTEARRQYEKFKTEQLERRFNHQPYQRKSSSYLEDVIDHHLCSAITKKDWKSEKFFAGWWKASLSKRRLPEIETFALEGLQKQLLAKGITPQRVNKYFAWLRKVLNQEVKRGNLLVNPVSRLTMFKEPKGRTRFLKNEEEEKLMVALGPIHGQWARFAMLTGLRQREQFSLKWSDVDLELSIATLLSTKAGDVQYVHLSAEAITILRSLDSWQRSIWVFPSRNPCTYMNPLNFYHRIWTPAVKQADIPWCTWHDLRHTFASRLAMKGYNEATLAALLRHSGTELVQRYAHLSPSHLKKAVDSLSSLSQSLPDTKSEELAKETPQF